MSRVTINQLPEPVKRGQVHPKDYWNDDYFKQLEPLVAALRDAVPEAKYDAKQLVFLLVQLLHFQEAALGKEAMQPKAAPKLPIKLITDPSVGGALHAIALKVHDIKRQRNLKAIEWQNPGKRRECQDIFLVLRRELERRELLVKAKVYISPSCGTEVQRLREYVRRLQGQLAESPDESGVTHIVHPFGPKGDPDDGKEYTTVLAIKGIQARVHYWYMPDSYDAWIPLHEVDNKEVVPDRTPPGGVWKVTPRWIIDSEKFNEWMNPADYTTPEMDEEMDAAEAADRGTKRAGSSLTGQAKKARGEEVAPEPLEVLGPTARLRQVLLPHKGMHDSAHPVENLSMGQINNHMAAYQPPLPPQAQPPAAADTAAAAAPGTGTAGVGSQQPVQQAAAAGAAAAGGSRPPPAPSRFAPVVGAAAGWFKPNQVHPLEKAALPEFFNGLNDGVAMYKQYRDAMLSLYWEHPERDLTFAEVRQHIDGEVNGLTRIYEFLQSWGLVNCKGAVRELMLPPSLGRSLSAHMPPGTASLYKFKKPSLLESTSAAQAGGLYGRAAALAASGDGRQLLHPVAGRKGTEEGLNPSCLAQIFCTAMPWVDCTRLRYHCTKQPDVNLCPLAYAKGMFPPGYCSKDFIRIDDSKHNSADGWTPEETMLLLEGIELYKEDWEKIASYVGKSQSACLTHFVRLPIEDPYVDDLLNWTATNKRGQQQPQQQQLPPVPFQDEPNPLMSTLGALSNIMGPRVAAAAAQASLQVLAEQDLSAGAVLNPEVRLASVLEAAKLGGSGSIAANGVSENGPIAQEAGGDAKQGTDTTQQQQQEGELDPKQPISPELVASAVAAGIAAAATRAHQLATAEEREIQRLMVGLVHDAAKRLDAKVNLLMQLMDPPKLDLDRTAAENAIKPLQQEVQQTSTTVAAARVTKKKQEEAAAAAAKQKHEALKKQQADALARQKAAAVAQHQQLQLAAAAAGKATASSQSQPPQQQKASGAESAPAPAPAAAPPAAAAAAVAQTAAGVGVPGGPVQQQQQQQLAAPQDQPPPLQQQQQQSQPPSQEQPTPGKSNVSMDSRGVGADSGVFEGSDDDLGELLEDIDGDGDVDIEGLGDDDEEMDMP